MMPNPEEKIIIDLSPLEEGDVPLFEKGKAYFREGRVLSCYKSSPQSFSGTVKGRKTYSCSLSILNGKLSFHSCDCEAHKRYPGPCKHVIALLLEVNEKFGKAPPEEAFFDGDPSGDGFFSDF